MNEVQKNVMELHRELGLHVGKRIGDVKDVELKLRLIGEEFLELARACGYEVTAVAGDDFHFERNMAHAFSVEKVYDALLDLEYVTNGAAVTWGMDLEPGHAEVHRSNMAKVGGPKRADGKALKPPGWKPPDLGAVLRRMYDEWPGDFAESVDAEADDAGASYEALGAELGRLVESKEEQYGQAWKRSGEILADLYPDGIQPHQYTDALLVVRTIDKLSRISQRGVNGQDLGGESPWRDLAGYGLIGLRKDEAAR